MFKLSFMSFIICRMWCLDYKSGSMFISVGKKNLSVHVNYKLPEPEKNR